MKKWNVDTAFGVDNLIETLNWIEHEVKGIVFSVILVRVDPELGELYRIVSYTIK